MPVRMMKPEELLECEKIQSVGFAYPLDVAELEKKLAAEPAPKDLYIGYINDDNVITACMELPKYQMRYEGHWVSMVGIGGVASLPEYRQGGAVRQILQAAFRQMVESGAVFSSLYPFSHPYYRKFGYDLCQMSTMYEVPIEALSTFRYTGKARMVQPTDPIEDIKAIFETHFSRYNMPIQREDRHWRKLLGKNPYKECRYTYVLENADGPSAYVVLTAESAGRFEKIGKVHEVAFVHPRGFADVLGFLYRLAAQYIKMNILLPDDIPLAAMVGESYELKGDYSNQQMTRVINVQKALELKQHFDGAAYILRVHDSDIPENDGVFSVRCQDGAVSVQKATDAGSADLTVDVRTLTQLLLGFLSLDEALFKADVQVGGNLETLRRVFAKRHVYLTDHF